MTMTGTRRRHKGFLGFIFGRQLDYVLELKPLFLLSLVLFCFSLVAGYSTGTTIGLEAINEKLQLLPSFEELSVLQVLMTLFTFIFVNNTVVSIMMISSGIFFGVPSLFLIALNGFGTGGDIYNLGLENGVPYVLMLLAPHGIIEISTIILSSAVGLSVGYSLINKLRGSGNLKIQILRALRLFMSKIIPLLLIAALIEILIPMLGVFFGLI